MLWIYLESKTMNSNFPLNENEIETKEKWISKNFNRGEIVYDKKKRVYYKVIDTWILNGFKCMEVKESSIKNITKPFYIKEDNVEKLSKIDLYVSNDIYLIIDENSVKYCEIEENESLELDSKVYIGNKRNPQKLSGTVMWNLFVNNEYHCCIVKLDENEDYDSILSRDFFKRFEIKLKGKCVLVNEDSVTKKVTSPKYEDTKGFVKVNEERREIRNSFVEELLNPDEYITFNSKELEQFKINDVVLFNFNNKKHKSVIKWTGIGNDELVALVELSGTYYDDDHPLNKYMTDGNFFNKQIVECKEKRIVGVKYNQISPFEPYTSKPIPEDKVFFPEIDIDSSVKYATDDLYGTVKWIGCDYNEENWFYGVEMDGIISNGTDGTFKNQRLFKCVPGFGKLYHIGVIVPDSRHISQNVNIEELPKSETCERYQVAIPIRSYEYCVGDNRGIQGNQNSCFFDSALFALFSHTDVLDFMINPNNSEITEDNTIEFRDILWQRIVCPLRKNGFVSLHQTIILRETVEKFGPKYKEMMNQVSDMENISSLLSKLCPNKQLVRLKSFSGAENQSMFIQLFVTLPRNIEYLSTQKMLELHMIQNNILFLEEPKCLIFQAPRDTLGINTYEYILPLNKIEISKLSYERFRKCYYCEEEAMFSCSECVEQNETYELSVGFRCNKHKCHEHMICQNLPRYEGPVRSKNKVYLTLTSIICIKSAHFVSYVRDPITNQWYFFDSISKQRKYIDVTIPCVEEARTIKDFVMKDEEDMIDHICMYNDEHLERITKYGYVFVYKNNSKLCY